jgi:hypothetical protein
MGGGVESRPTNCRDAAQHLHHRKIDGVGQVVKLSPNCRYKPESLAVSPEALFVWKCNVSHLCMPRDDRVRSVWLAAERRQTVAGGAAPGFDYPTSKASERRQVLGHEVSYKVE